MLIAFHRYIPYFVKNWGKFTAFFIVLVWTVLVIFPYAFGGQLKAFSLPGLSMPGTNFTFPSAIIIISYLNSVKILKYIKFKYKFKLIKGQAWFLQYKPALFTPNLEND